MVRWIGWGVTLILSLEYSRFFWPRLLDVKVWKFYLAMNRRVSEHKLRFKRQVDLLFNKFLTVKLANLIVSSRLFLLLFTRHYIFFLFLLFTVYSLSISLSLSLPLPLPLPDLHHWLHLPICWLLLLQ